MCEAVLEGLSLAGDDHSRRGGRRRPVRANRLCNYMHSRRSLPKRPPLVIVYENNLTVMKPHISSGPLGYDDGPGTYE